MKELPLASCTRIEPSDVCDNIQFFPEEFPVMYSESQGMNHIPVDILTESLDISSRSNLILKTCAQELMFNYSRHIACNSEVKYMPEPVPVDNRYLLPYRSPRVIASAADLAPCLFEIWLGYCVKDILCQWNQILTAEYGDIPDYNELRLYWSPFVCRFFENTYSIPDNTKQQYLDFQVYASIEV